MNIPKQIWVIMFQPRGFGTMDPPKAPAFIKVKQSSYRLALQGPQAMATAVRNTQPPSPSRVNKRESTIAEPVASKGLLARIFTRRRKVGPHLELVRKMSAAICETVRLLPFASEARTFEQLSLTCRQTRKLEHELTFSLSRTVFTALMPEDIYTVAKSLSHTLAAVVKLSWVLEMLPRPAFNSVIEAVAGCADELHNCILLLPADVRGPQRTLQLSIKIRQW